MKRAAEDYLGCEIKKAVITVPAYFTDGQKQATKDAGILAGLQVLAILPEPTAAAIAYGLQHKNLESRNVLIYDLGGGTFDVAILQMSSGNIDVLTVDGDTHLGGEDFDNSLVEFAALEFQSLHGIDLRVGKDSQVEQERNGAFRILRRLKSECEDRKVNLSTCKKSTVSVDAIKNGLDLSVPIARDKFEAMNTTLFEKTITIVERALNSAGINKSSIDDIVLVGGSTRIPKIQQLLTDYFGGKALNKTINADEAVAFGAAIHAAILNGDIAKDSVDFTKIRDIVPMSLGIELHGGDFAKIIAKNTKIPVSLQDTFHTAFDNQTSVKITVYQGENLVAKNNDKLGEFILDGIPPAPAGNEGVDVEMQVDDEGILHVSVVSCTTGGKNDLTITEYKNRLSRTTIQKLLNEGTSAAA
jgi:molecular chaperone DnaK (HSP70)